MMRVLVAVLWCLPVILRAQLPANSIGNNPSGEKWSQINTDRFQIVFPESQKSSGLRVAQLVDDLWEKEVEGIGDKREKVSIFLQGDRILSNGVVTVGPFRSEIYQTPPQFANSTDYTDLVAIHEYRHVKQFSNADRGITKFARDILGSWAWGGMMALAMPRWYFEGDAVIAETEHSLSGRGRLPSFNMQYYAWHDADEMYGYEKAGAGSLTDYVPDWYPLGYNILTHAREKYGTDLWREVTEDAVKYKGLFWSFNKSIKRRTGLTTQALYKESMQANKEDFLRFQKGAMSYDKLTPSRSTVTNYSMPQPWGSRLIVRKAAYDEIGAFYMIDDKGIEKKLIEHGVLPDGAMNTLSRKGNVITWAELGFDPRWNYRQWSNIYIYNFATGIKRQLTSKTRYLSPTLDDGAKKIAAVHVASDQSQSLVLLDVESGEKIDTWDNEESYLLSHPTWTPDDKIVVVASKYEKSRLLLIDLENENSEVISPATSHQLTHPFATEEGVYYAASYEPINNIYFTDYKDLKVQKVTTAKVGAFQPAIGSDGSLYFSEFSNDGFVVSKLDVGFDKVAYQPEGVAYADRLKGMITSNGVSELIGEEEDFEVKRYNKWSGILNPHSIVPEFDNPFATVRLLSDNKFSTLSAEANTTYNFNEDEWSYAVGLRYAELYPIINVSYARGFRNAALFNFDGLTDTSLVQTFYIERWTEDRVTAGVTLPYNFSKGNMSNQMSLRLNYQTAKITTQDQFNDPQFSSRDTFQFGASNQSSIEELYGPPLLDGNLSTLDMSFSVGMLKRKALQHIQPRLGFVAFTRIRRNIGDNDLGGNVFTIGGDLYLPGFAKTHNFYINTMYQREQMLDNYRYGDAFRYPRGYNTSLRRDELFKIGFNYEFPIAYPDWAIGGFAFLKRIRANAFFDLGRVGVKSFPFEQSVRNMNSTGVELGLDFRAFRLVEVDMGVRYSYLLNEAFAFNGRRHQFDFFVISITQ